MSTTNKKNSSYSFKKITNSSNNNIFDSGVFDSAIADKLGGMKDIFNNFENIRSTSSSTEYSENYENGQVRKVYTVYLNGIKTVYDVSDDNDFNIEDNLSLTNKLNDIENTNWKIISQKENQEETSTLDKFRSFNNQINESESEHPEHHTKMKPVTSEEKQVDSATKSTLSKNANKIKKSKTMHRNDNDTHNIKTKNNSSVMLLTGVALIFVVIVGGILLLTH